MTPNTQDVLKRIDESNKPVYTLQLPGNQKKDHDSLESLGSTLNDLVLQIINDPDTDKIDKLKKIKQAYTVNGAVIDQLSKHHENITEQIQKKIERFENA